MSQIPVPDLENINLEDSYFLGAVAEGASLRLRVLFVLTADHPDYDAPLPGEQHCYREGSILIDGAAVQTWQGRAAPLCRDADGQIDFGSIEVSGAQGDLRIETEMFVLRLDAGSMTMRLD